MYDVVVMGRCFFVSAQIVLDQSSSNPKQSILSLLATDASTGFCRISPFQNCPSRGLSNVPFPWVELLIPSELSMLEHQTNVSLSKQWLAQTKRMFVTMGDDEFFTDLYYCTTSPYQNAFPHAPAPILQADILIGRFKHLQSKHAIPKDFCNTHNLGPKVDNSYHSELSTETNTS